MSGTEAWNDCHYARRTGDPIAKFSRWLDDARRPKSRTTRRCTRDGDEWVGKVSIGFVLLKGIDRRGFMFFAHARIRKGM